MARNNHASADDISTGLSVGFDQDDADDGLQGEEPANTDPIRPTEMVVDLDEVELYDRNPRLRQNPEYEAIKASILASGGLDSTVPVTRRDPSEPYMAAAGHNTRLAILKDLVTETDDPKLARELGWLRVTFLPWAGEARTHLRHLLENVNRGDLTFFELARGLMEQWALRTDEGGDKPSLRQFVTQLQQEGYKDASRRTLGRYRYAVEVLDPPMRSALVSGAIGSTDTDKLQKVDTTYRGYFAEALGRDPKDEDTAEQAMTLFQEVVAEFDAEDLDLSNAMPAIRRALDARFAEVLDVTPENVQHETDALLGLSSDDQAGDDDSDEAEVDHPPEADSLDQAGTDAGGDEDEDEEEAIPPPGEQPPEVRLEQARLNAYKRASQIAEEYELDDLVQRIDNGYGYWIELPSDPLSSADTAMRHWVWWLLAGTSGIFEEEAALAALPEEAEVAAAIQASGQKRLRSRVGDRANVGDLPTLYRTLPQRHRKILFEQLPAAVAAVAAASEQLAQRIWAPRNRTDGGQH